MTFYVSGCLFDKHVYLYYEKEDGLLSTLGNKLKNGKWCTFVYCHQDLICVCYDCLISLLKVRKHNVDSLRETCELCTSDSYISRVVHQSAKTCFESVLPYLKMNEYSGGATDVDLPIGMICSRCFKHLVVCYNIFSDLYVLKK